jgi:hypothetical protein
MPSVKAKTRRLMCPTTQGIWEYEVMDVTTYPAWNGATVASLADVTDQAENTAAPTSGLLANPRMFNVIGGRLHPGGGGWLKGRRMILLEFPNADKAREWYAELHHLPEPDNMTRHSVILLEGIEN